MDLESTCGLGEEIGRGGNGETEGAGKKTEGEERRRSQRDVQFKNYFKRSAA